MKSKFRLLTLALSLLSALGVLSGGAGAVSCSGGDGTAWNADSAAYYELEAPARPVLLAEPVSGTWEGDGYFDEETDEWKVPSGTWTLDAAGTLAVEGTGEPPWDLYRQWNADSVRRLAAGDGITHIPSEWFSNRYGNSRGKNLVEVVLSDTVTSVGDSAFYGCASLAGVTLGEGITVIGVGAFQRTGLTELSLPACLPEIGVSAFAECDQLDAIAVAEGNAALRAIDGVVFSADGKTLALYPSGRRGPYGVPAGTEKIGDGAFSGARGLTAVTLPAGVSEIGAWAFPGCDALAGLTLPESLRTIGESAFSGCGALTELALPQGLEEIGTKAFSGCGALAGLTLPEGLRAIGESAFSGCGALTELVFPQGLEEIGASAFSQCRALTRALLPDGLETVGEYAFVSCSKLKTVSLPGTLRSLGAYAFQFFYGMTDLTLGEGISRIENRAFDGCTRIQRLMLPRSLTYIGSDVFTSATEADVHFAGTDAEWKAVRLGYNALPGGLRVRCGSTGPTEPDVDAMVWTGWPFYDWEHESTVWDLSLTIDNGGSAGDTAVRAALYDKDGRFLGLQHRTLTLEEGEKTYDLGTLAFPGVDQRSVYRGRVFLTDAAASPLCRAL